MKDLKKAYFEKTNFEPSNNVEFLVIKMRKQLHKKFDEIWVKYNQNKATYKEWEKSLNKWLATERM